MAQEKMTRTSAFVDLNSSRGDDTGTTSRMVLLLPKAFSSGVAAWFWDLPEQLHRQLGHNPSASSAPGRGWSSPLSIAGESPGLRIPKWVRLPLLFRLMASLEATIHRSSSVPTIHPPRHHLHCHVPRFVCS
jgi:hypothetical protein